MSIDFIVKNQALNQQIYTLLKQEILHHQLQPESVSWMRR